MNIFKILFTVSLFLIFLNGFSQEKTTDSQLATQYFQNREFEKAAILYEKLFKNTKSRIYFNYYLDCLIEMKDFKEAEKVLTKQIKRNRNDLTYFVDYGRVLKLQGLQDAANVEYNEAIKRLDASVSQVHSLANAFIKENELGYAEKTYLKGRNIISHNPFFGELAAVYARQRNYEKMADELLNYLMIAPNKLEEVQSQLQNLIVNDTDNEIRQMFKEKLLGLIQSKQSNQIYSELLIWLYVQEKNFRGALIQVKALDKRNNEGGRRIVKLAEVAASNNFFDIALKAYQYVIDKGNRQAYYFQARFGMLDVLYKKVVSGLISTTEEIVALENSYKQTIDELGRSRNTIKIIQDLAHLQAFYLNKPYEAMEFLEGAIEMGGLPPQIKAQCKIELGDILLLVDDIWEATLTYAEVEENFKHDAIGHEAKFRKAKLAYYTGDFEWAQAQLDILKASTSKLIANDAFELSLLINDNTALDTSIVALQMFANAELMIKQNKDTLALALLDSISKKFQGHTLDDDILMKKSEIARKTRNFEKEIKYLKDIVDNYSYDILADNAMFRMAEIYETELNDKAKAMELYKSLMVSFPGSIFVIEARKRFRSLRGDKKDKTDDFYDFNQNNRHF